MRYLCLRCGHDFGQGRIEDRQKKVCPDCQEDVGRANRLMRPMEEIVWEWWEGELANDEAKVAIPDEATRY